jgi:hypothetical protein
MRSLSHRFLFIHVPKTAGNALQNVLRQYSDDTVVCIAPYHDGLERFEVRSSTYGTVKHSTLADYRREYGVALLGELFKFCVVRNPWDRCVSHFLSPHRGTVTWNKRKFLKFVRSEIRPLSFYISADPVEETTLERSLKNVDFVMRFERLQEDFDEVCVRVDIPKTSLPRRNSSGKADFRSYYDSESAAYVSARFHDEIAHFGYTLS